MSEKMAAFEYPVDSPALPVDSGIVHTPKEFSDALTLELTDEEISRALQVILPIRKKWSARFRAKLRHGNFTVEDAMRLTEKFEDEIHYELATKLDILADVDVSPVFYGEPPIIDILGALPSHSSAKYGLDHEKKEYEVKRAIAQGEGFLGESKLDEV